MKSVLVVDDDRALLDALALELDRLGYGPLTATSADEALSILEATTVDVLVTDLRMRGRDGIDLLRACRELDQRTRMILMSAYATARDYKVARSVGAVEVLVKPFAPEEFAEAVRRAESFDAGFQADVIGLTLVDVLQLFHHGRRSVAVRVGEIGVIHMKDGEVVHAHTATRSGAGALIELLSIEAGVISTGAPEDVPHTISRPFETLLLGTLALIDERRANKRPVTAPPLVQVPGPSAADSGMMTSTLAPAIPSVTSVPPARGAPMTAVKTVLDPPTLEPEFLEPIITDLPAEPAPPPMPVQDAVVPAAPPAAAARVSPTVDTEPLPVARLEPTAPMGVGHHHWGLGVLLLVAFAGLLFLTLWRPPEPPSIRPAPPGMVAAAGHADGASGPVAGRSVLPRRGFLVKPPPTVGPARVAGAMAPSTAAPTSAAPTSMAPASAAPLSAAPASVAMPSTAAPATAAPATAAPATAAPATAAPASVAMPRSAAPRSAAPRSAAPRSAAARAPASVAAARPPARVSPRTAPPAIAPSAPSVARVTRKARRWRPRPKPRVADEVVRAIPKPPVVVRVVTPPKRIAAPGTRPATPVTRPAFEPVVNILEDDDDDP